MRLSQIESYYCALKRLREPSELVEVIQSITCSNTIRGIFIARLPNPGEDLTPNIMLRGWNENWIEYYAKKNYVHHDPIAQELRRRDSIFVWSEVCKNRKLTSLEHTIMREARCAGLDDGLTVPVFGPRLQTTCVSFSTIGSCTEENFDSESRQTLQLIASMAVAKLDEFSSSGQNKTSTWSLALREKQCLALVGKGLTSKQIERETGLAYRTVDFYIGRAARKLNARSRAEAFNLALKYRIISL